MRLSFAVMMEYKTYAKIFLKVYFLIQNVYESSHMKWITVT
jgi:hypothetical protein